MKKTAPNKFAVQFLLDNGFELVEDNNHYANNMCGVVITETNYEVCNNNGDVIYSHDLNLYWLTGFLLWYEFISRNFKKPL